MIKVNKEANEHTEIIRNTVFHTYPFNAMGFKPDAPHAEDCGGCLINAEVEKLVDELNALHIVRMNEALEKIKEERRVLTIDRWDAFERAGISEEGSVADLVGTLVNDRDSFMSLLQTSKDENEALINERDRLRSLLQTIENDINSIATKIIREHNAKVS